MDVTPSASSSCSSDPRAQFPPRIRNHQLGKPVSLIQVPENVIGLIRFGDFPPPSTLLRSMDSKTETTQSLKMEPECDIELRPTGMKLCSTATTSYTTLPSGNVVFRTVNKGPMTLKQCRVVVKRLSNPEVFEAATRARLASLRSSKLMPCVIAASSGSSKRAAKPAHASKKRQLDFKVKDYWSRPIEKATSDQGPSNGKPNCVKIKFNFNKPKSSASASTTPLKASPPLPKIPKVAKLVKAVAIRRSGSEANRKLDFSSTIERKSFFEKVTKTAAVDQSNSIDEEITEKKTAKPLLTVWENLDEKKPNANEELFPVIDDSPSKKLKMTKEIKSDVESLPKLTKENQSNNGSSVIFDLTNEFLDYGDEYELSLAELDLDWIS